MLTKDELLEPLARLRGNAIVVTCMGVTRPWGRYSRSELDFASADSAMGHTADFSLGIALACPRRKIVCLNGDGRMLMTLGTLATVVQARAANYVLIVVQNDTYEITGNQSVPGAGQVDFAALALAAGFPRVYSIENASEYLAALPEMLDGEGPMFAAIKVRAGTEGPISRSDRETSEYLKVSLADWARRLKQALTRSEIA